MSNYDDDEDDFWGDGEDFGSTPPPNPMAPVPSGGPEAPPEAPPVKGKEMSSAAKVWVVTGIALIVIIASITVLVVVKNAIADRDTSSEPVSRTTVAGSVSSTYPTPTSSAATSSSSSASSASSGNSLTQGKGQGTPPVLEYSSPKSSTVIVKDKQVEVDGSQLLYRLILTTESGDVTLRYDVSKKDFETFRKGVSYRLVYRVTTENKIAIEGLSTS